MNSIVHIKDSDVLSNFLGQLFVDQKRGCLSNQCLNIWDYVIGKILDSNIDKMDKIVELSVEEKDFNEYIKLSLGVINDSGTQDNKRKQDSDENDYLKNRVEMLETALEELMILLPTMS